MTPFHYSIVQCRDFAVAGERRNVGVLVASPSQRQAWLRRGDLRGRAHLVGDDAGFVRALLDSLLSEAREVAREGLPATLHAWMRARSLPTEDVLTLSPPAMGIATDLEAELARLARIYVGKPPARGQKAADKLVGAVLKQGGWAAAFTARAMSCGPATWRFPRVADVGGAPIVLNALSFEQTTPEGLLDGAFHNIGRVGEVNAYHRGVRWVTVATPPKGGGAAFQRACELMDGAGLGLVAPEPAALAEVLKPFLEGGGRSTASLAT